MVIYEKVSGSPVSPDARSSHFLKYTSNVIDASTCKFLVNVSVLDPECDPVAEDFLSGHDKDMIASKAYPRLDLICAKVNYRMVVALMTFMP
jgi:hypothetical protein